MSAGVAELLEGLRREIDGPPFHKFLRPVAGGVDPATGAVTVSLAYRPEFARAADSPGFHGGIVASLIDLTGHAAIALRIGRMAPTIDLRVDYLRMAPDSELIAVARVVRAGRTVAVVDIDVTDAQARLVAVGRGVFSTAASATRPAAAELGSFQ